MIRPCPGPSGAGTNWVGVGGGGKRARGNQHLYWGFCFAQRGAVTVRDVPHSFSGRLGE